MKAKRIVTNRVSREIEYKGIGVKVMGRNNKDCLRRLIKIKEDIDNGLFPLKESAANAK